MSWLALSDAMDPRVALSAQDVGPLMRGTLMLEVSVQDDTRNFDVVVAQKAENSTIFRLAHAAGAGFFLHHKHGEEDFGIALKPQMRTGHSDFLIAYSWDLQHRWARLATVAKGATTPDVRVVEDPLPLDWALLADLFSRPVNRLLGVQFCALSNEIEPLGPFPTLLSSHVLNTGLGPKPLREIARGDSVQTTRGTVQPVLHAMTRTFPAAGRFRPVRLRAPFFGVSKDMVVSADQTLTVSGTDVGYIFGQSMVRVFAGDLLGTPAAHPAHSHPFQEYTGLLLPGAEPLAVNGAALDSVCAARLRRKPGILAHTTLAGVPRNFLPEHPPATAPLLTAFEAVTLMEARAA